MSSVSMAGATPAPHKRTGQLSARLGRALLYALAIALGFIFVMPFLWMLMTELKSRGELNLFPPTLWPNVWTPSNFLRIWAVQNFGRFLVNSTVYSVGAVIGT